MIDEELLKILVCPETKQEVELAGADLVAKINDAIQGGGLLNRAGQKIEQKIDGGLVRKDSVYLYPIRDEIPVMLIDEAIPIKKLKS